MGFKDVMKSVGKQLTKAGWVHGHDFPMNTIFHFSEDDGDNAITITFPSGEEMVITHDQVKYAAILCTGVIELQNNSKGGTTLIYGTKIRFELVDGKTGVITCNLGKSLDKIECVFF